ncbi:hypothetical protein FAZ69_17105 [Trinickia terrae]|uniref:Amidase domain-containing protein n=1 Tax=Trinickia terrae TaxID=2571161 RepID=A0A4U1I413_9BURK|nr:hypothetical protein FAZ69_17105 [Trinickia terrae]
MDRNGLKPTVGRISRDDIIPISHTQDTPGPITRTVGDAAILLTAMAGSGDCAGGVRAGLAGGRVVRRAAEEGVTKRG